MGSLLHSQWSVAVPPACFSRPVPHVSHSQAYEQRRGQTHGSTVTARLGEAGQGTDGGLMWVVEHERWDRPRTDTPRQTERRKRATMRCHEGRCKGGRVEGRCQADWTDVLVNISDAVPSTENDGRHRLNKALRHAWHWINSNTRCFQDVIKVELPLHCKNAAQAYNHVSTVCHLL